MEIIWLYRTIILFFLLLLSALYSGSEVALFSLDEKKLETIDAKSGIIGKYITTLLKFPRRLLVTILIGNTLANVAASIISVSLALDIAKVYNLSFDLALIVQIITLTAIVILFAEISPKVWANKHPIIFAKVISIPLYWTFVLVSPVSYTITKLIRFATSKVKFDKSKTALSSEEITDLADIGVEKGTLVEEEHGLIHGLVAFRTITVREVMTPRVDIVALPDTILLDELIELIKGSGHSRIPVYKEDLDNILGVLYAKDLLPYLNIEDVDSKFDLPKVIRECLFVPETKLISNLMQEFQRKNMHMSIVVDEYGGTSGLITLEDILEEIVGEIRDEFDDEEDEIKELSETKFLMTGKADIDEIEEILKIKIEVPDEDFETLGGFIFSHAGTIPEVGYQFEEYGYKFRVTEIESNRITKVEIEKISAEGLEK